MTQTEKQTGERWLDIGACGWLIRYTLANECWMDFKAYEALGKDYEPAANDPYGGAIFRRKGVRGSGNETENPDEAESIDGFVKWDGCSEIETGRQHFCGRADVESFGKVLVAIHDLARDVIPKFNRKVGA
jgi:hypothetical protein